MTDELELVSIQMLEYRIKRLLQEKRILEEENERLRKFVDKLLNLI